MRTCCFIIFRRVGELAGLAASRAPLAALAARLAAWALRARLHGDVGRHLRARVPRQRSAGRLQRYRLRRRSRMRPRRQRSLAARREERGGANCRVSAPVPELRALSLHQRGRHRWPSGARLLVVCRLCRADRRGGFERRRCRLARLRSSGQGGVGGPAPRAHGRRRCHDAGTDAGGRLVDRAWCGPGAPRVCPRDLKRRHRHREVGQAARVRLGSR